MTGESYEIDPSDLGKIKRVEKEIPEIETEDTSLEDGKGEANEVEGGLARHPADVLAARPWEGGDLEISTEYFALFLGINTENGDYHVMVLTPYGEERPPYLNRYPAKVAKTLFEYVHADDSDWIADERVKERFDNYSIDKKRSEGNRQYATFPNERKKGFVVKVQNVSENVLEFSKREDDFFSRQGEKEKPKPRARESEIDDSEDTGYGMVAG